jgi:hypothetical protein
MIPPHHWSKPLYRELRSIAVNAIAPRNGGRIESDFQLQARTPLSWCVCLAAFYCDRHTILVDFAMI